MSELFQRRSQEETLGRIQERLNENASPAAIIAEMLPQTRDEALSWGRRLTIWEEYHRHYPAQVIALARVISRRAMHEYALTLQEDGRVIERPAEGKPWKTPRPAATFALTVGGEEVRVEYVPEYFPNSGTGLLSFLSPHEPPKPHALSETGCLARFVSPDAVEACGGPQAYAAMLAEALIRGEVEQLSAALEGTPQEATKPRRDKTPRPQPASESPPSPGGHIAKVLAENAPQKPPKQGMLF
jgi:hypothetical protein